MIENTNMVDIGFPARKDNGYVARDTGAAMRSLGSKTINQAFQQP